MILRWLCSFMSCGFPSVNVTITITNLHRCVFVAVITDWSRADVLDLQLGLWVRNMIQLPYVVDLRFFGCLEINSNQSEIVNRYVEVPRYHGERSRDLMVSKLLVAVNMSINSGAGWLLRLCDDAYVDLEVFPRLMEEVLQIGDPFRKPIFQGDVVWKSQRNYGYIQGGSGMIMSSAGAQMIHDQRDTIVQIVAKIRNDDTALGLWMSMNNISGAELTNRWFLGHRFQQVSAAADLLNMSRLTIHKCPYTLTTHPRVRGFLHRVKDIAIWHDRTFYRDFLPRASEIKRYIPDTLWFYHITRNPVLCIGVNDSKLGYTPVL